MMSGGLVPFFQLSYPVQTPSSPDAFPDSPHYNTGPLDACVVLTCIAVMAVLRDAFRLGVFEPFARWYLARDSRKRRENGNHHANGDVSIPRRREAHRIHRSVLRFAEQGWAALYYSLQWAFGFYIHRNLPTQILNPVHLWLNYPHIPLAGPIKFYYLTQTAFYLHQLLILNAEARRKDHVQMMAHHIITIALITLSYVFNCTRVGCLIMVLMDYCDIFLPMAKMLRYLSLRMLCDATFVWFLFSWFVTRHVLFNFVIYSVYTHVPRLIPFVWAPERGLYFTKGIWTIFFSMLLALQALQVIWFGMICRVAWRVLIGQGADDERSDDESAQLAMMESLMSYFGGRRDPNKSAREAIIVMKQQLTVLEKKEEFLHQRIDAETKKAKASAVTNKPAAMTALRRKKQSEAELERLMGTQLQLEMQINTLESANLNAETMAAIRKASKALSDIHSGLTVSKVESIMDKLSQEIETQKEIQNVLVTDMVGSGIDEDALLKELNELEQDQLNERLQGAEHVPIHAPAGPSTVEDASRRRAEEEDEEAQLKELQAALAM